MFDESMGVWFMFGNYDSGSVNVITVVRGGREMMPVA
jgi:hypothetical protein